MKALIAPPSICCLSIALFSFALDAPAMVIPVEGHAGIHLVLISEPILVCSKNVSGEEQEELFALNTTDRTVKWRHKAKRVSPSAVADKAGNFYMFADNVLQKRELRSGSVVWEARLDTIPEQKTPPRLTLKEHAQRIVEKLTLAPAAVAVLPRVSTTPNFYAYQPVLSESTLIVFREAMSGGGCIVMTCFRDWLTFSIGTGKNIAGGSGELLGTAGNTALFKDPYGVLQMKGNDMDELNVPSLPAGSHLMNWFHSRLSGAQYSSHERCIFKDGRNDREELFIFDSRKSEISSVKLPVPRGFQVNWVLLDGHLLRYGECQASPGGKPSDVSPWFELYDLKGQLIGRTNVTTMPDGSWYLRFLGTSA